MENGLQCYNVHCVEKLTGNHIDVGVMSLSKEAALKSAVYSLLEGRHIEATAVDADETEAI